MTYIPDNAVSLVAVDSFPDCIVVDTEVADMVLVHRLVVDIVQVGLAVVRIIVVVHIGPAEEMKVDYHIPGAFCLPHALQKTGAAATDCVTGAFMFCPQ